MVSNLKNVGRSEMLRMDQLYKKIEVCQVTRVWTHADPNDYNWMSCDVIIQDAVPLNGQEVSIDGPAWRRRVPVRQDLHGDRCGHPWTPRVGDSVLVLFYMNDRAVIIGTLPKEFQKPVCRSSANFVPWTQESQDASFEDWTDLDFHNYYDHRLKLVQWLHIPRRYIMDAQGRPWPTTFDHSKVDPTGKLRPVCFNYLDETRDFYVCWECLPGKLFPDCKSCTSNFYGPDWLKDVDDHTETYNAMNAWLKNLSTDYEGSDDLPRRLKYRHHGGTLLCLDAAYPSNSKFQACELHRGRVWLESAELGKDEPVPSAFGHIHFRAEANLLEQLYPCTPVGYGKFNLSLRSMPTLGAHLELWGNNALKGRADLANEERGKVQADDIHASTSPDQHVTLTEDEIIQVHALSANGEIYAIAAKKITIQCGSSIITLEPAKITVQSPDIELDGDVHITGDLTVDGVIN